MTRKWATRNSFAKIQADSNARFAIEMWRVVAILLWINKDFFPVPIESLAWGYMFLIHYKIKTDASPWKLAAAIFSMDGHMLAYTTLVLPYKDPDNKYQNVKEFSGGILGCILASIFSETIKPHQNTMDWRQYICIGLGRREQMFKQSSPICEHCFYMVSSLLERPTTNNKTLCGS
jgi:hypothetical protein